MARPKKTVSEPAQTDIEDAIKAKKDQLLAELRTQTPADLIKRYRELDAWMDEQTKKLSEFLAPHREITNAINAVMLEKALAEQVNSFSTEFGTAYISKGFSYKVDPNAQSQYVDPTTGEISTGREALLDWALANWDDYGAPYLAVTLPADGVKAYAEATKNDQHPEGLLPPGITAERWMRLNIRKA